MFHDWPQASKEWVPKVRKHLDHWTAPVVAEAFREMVGRLLAGHRAYDEREARATKPGYDLLLDVDLERQSEWSIGQIRMALSERSPKGHDFKWISDQVIRAMMRTLGWVDDCSGAIPWFRKVT
jgi:hypothetical protein